MKNLIRKILEESVKEKFINTMVDKIRSGSIKAPYFKNLDKFEVSDVERKKIFKKLFGEDIRIDLSHGYYSILDDEGNEIYDEYSGGYWKKSEYDDRRNKIYHEDSSGYWWKRQYDGRANLIYHEDSGGYWKKSEYDDRGNLIYREDSDEGVIVDKR